jgi:hypothetical protein
MREFIQHQSGEEKHTGHERGSPDEPGRPRRMGQLQPACQRDGDKDAERHRGVVERQRHSEHAANLEDSSDHQRSARIIERD